MNGIDFNANGARLFAFLAAGMAAMLALVMIDSGLSAQTIFGHDYGGNNQRREVPAASSTGSIRRLPPLVAERPSALAAPLSTQPAHSGGRYPLFLERESSQQSMELPRPRIAFRQPQGPLEIERLPAPKEAESIETPLGEQTDGTVSLEELVVLALSNSPRVRSIALQPAIRQTAVTEAQAEFDPRLFLESRYARLDEPVGNALTTGGPSRFLDETWKNNAGLAGKTERGETWEVKQRLGYEDSNSLFFIPPQQGQTEFSVEFTKPLLNGSGRAYNASLILLADLGVGTARDEVKEQLQEHVFSLVDSYWALVRERKILRQKQKYRTMAAEILGRLEARETVDSVASQVVQAEAAVAARDAELARADADIRNAEAEIRVLVGTRALQQIPPGSLTPANPPDNSPTQIDPRLAVQTAMQHRPEINRTLLEIKQASVREGIARNELLPILNLVMAAHTTGLAGKGNVGTAWGNQFSQGGPSYSAGLLFELPLYNRAANARLRRRELESQRLALMFESTIESLSQRVQAAVREVEATFRELEGRRRAWEAAALEVRYNEQRWIHHAGEIGAANLILQNLLDAQDRMADEDEKMAQAEYEYNVAIAALQKEMGVLLRNCNPQNR